MSVEVAMARFERMAFAQFLRVRVAQVSHERAVLRLPFQENNANQGGVLHGGATASLIHMAGTLAAWTGLDLQAEPLVNTVNLSVSILLRPCVRRSRRKPWYCVVGGTFFSWMSPFVALRSN